MSGSMNDTFTSQKAKRNVSDYYNIRNRPIRSREKERKKIDSRTSPGFSIIGLENIGNSCYLNVILQCLFHLKSFNSIFMDGSFRKMLNHSQKSSIWETYAELFNKTLEPVTPMKPTKSRMAWKRGIQDYISPKEFKSELVKSFPNYLGYDQHDAHELFTSILEVMCLELNRVK